MRFNYGVLVLSTLLGTNPISAQSPPKSPKEVLQAYRDMDAAGERLTAKGWYQASEFFVKLAERPPHYVVGVTGGERVDNPDPWFRGGANRAKVSISGDALGQIDASGRFTSVVVPAFSIDSSGTVKRPAPPFVHGPTPLARIYYLVLTDTHWEFGPHQEGPTEVKGQPEWRIETFEFEPWVTTTVAIRYLTQLREGSTSKVIKSNAEKSISALRRLLKR